MAMKIEVHLTKADLLPIIRAHVAGLVRMDHPDKQVRVEHDCAGGYQVTLLDPAGVKEEYESDERQRKYLAEQAAKKEAVKKKMAEQTAALDCFGEARIAGPLVSREQLAAVAAIHGADDDL